MATATMPTLDFPSASPLATRCPGVTTESQCAELTARFNACGSRDEWEALNRRFLRLEFTTWPLDQAREVAGRRVTR